MGHADLLARCDLFAGLDAGVLAGLAAASRPVALVRNEVLFEEGEQAAELFVVRAGRVAVVKRSDDGRESLLALMGPGDIFGEMGLFDGEGRSAEARALEATELAALPYPLLRDAFVASPPALWALVRLLAGRIRTTDEVLADSMFLDVTGRTAKRLLDLVGGDGEFGAAVTQEELAAMVGASRERVNKAIAGFVRQGLLEQVGGRYRVIDGAGLQSRAR